MKRMYRCRVCGKEFPKPHGLEIHKRIKHNGKHKSQGKKKARSKPRPSPRPAPARSPIRDVQPESGNSEALIERLRERALKHRQTADEIDSRIKVIEQTITKYLK